MSAKAHPSTESIINKHRLTVEDAMRVARFVAPLLIIAGTVVIPLYVESVKSSAVGEANHYTDIKLKELKDDLKKDLERIDGKLDRISQYLLERKP